MSHFSTVKVEKNDGSPDGTPTEFGENSTLRISLCPKQAEFSAFNVPALRPSMVPGQPYVFPFQRRQVLADSVEVGFSTRNGVERTAALGRSETVTSAFTLVS